MGTIWGQLLLQFTLIFLNAVFACAEIAVLSVNEAKLSKYEGNETRKVRKLRRLTEQPSKFLSTIQVAITLSGFLGSAFASDNFASRLTSFVITKWPELPRETVHSFSVIVITLILSYITLICGELVPKRIAMKQSEKMALGMAPMLCGVAKIFTPLVWLLSASTNGVLRLLGFDPNEEDEQVSEEEIRFMVDEGSQAGVIDEQEQELIQNIFEFDDLTVSEFATHRTDIAILWLEDDNEKWEEIIHDTRHSVYPVCDETIDNVVGTLSIKDFFRYRNMSREEMIEEIVRPAYFVPEGIHADVLFKQMKKMKNHFAVVLDEYGGMMGIVTMNDLVEQIVGELDDGDETVPEEPDFTKLSDDTWEARGVAPLDLIAEELEIELPLEQYDTIGGYVFAEYGVVPEDGTTFELELPALHVCVTEIKDHRISKMTLTRLVVESDEDEDEDEDEE